MFDWVGSIGPLTWAMVGLYLLLVVGMMLLNRGNVITLLGVLIVVGSSAAAARILSTQGSRDPVLHTPWAGTTALVVMIALGIGFIVNRTRNRSAGPDLRARIPQFNSSAIASVVIGAVLILAAGSVVVNRLDLPSNNANRGFEIAGQGASSQITNALGIIERFLAR